jgi:hypothetical protein
MFRVDFKEQFEKFFPWHYDAMAKDTNDCPALGNLELDYKSITEHVVKLCETQDPKNNGRGWAYYFENGKVKEDIVADRPESFQKMFEVWRKTGWTKDNSCFYEFQDEEMGDFYKVIVDAYQEKFGEMKHKQLRVFLKPPMTALGLHCDTYNSYSRKHNAEISKIFRVLTTVEDWQWGHYNLIGNNVVHQHRAGDCYQIKPNVFHLSGNLGFNPMITMNITGICR